MFAIELFCCSGGMTEGFRRAGIHFSHAFDADPNACASYEANLGHAPIQCDVRELIAAPMSVWPEIDQVLHASSKHPANEPDEPAPTIRGGGDGHSAPDVVLHADAHHPPHYADEPANTLRAGDGQGARNTLVLDHARSPQRLRTPKSWHGQSVPQSQRASSPDEASSTITTSPHKGAALAWPWDRPATTVTAREMIGAPGHHDTGHVQKQPNAIKLSEKAAAILQGFPPNWEFSGATKSARWSQLGQAVPIALARAVATSVVKWFARDRKFLDDRDRVA